MNAAFRWIENAAAPNKFQRILKFRMVLSIEIGRFLVVLPMQQLQTQLSNFDFCWNSFSNATGLKIVFENEASADVKRYVKVTGRWGTTPEKSSHNLKFISTLLVQTQLQSTRN